MGLIRLSLCFPMDERIPLIHDFWVPVDIVSVKSFTLLTLLFAFLQLHHPIEGPPTAVHCCYNIDGGVGVFGGAKSFWLLSIFF